MTTAVDDLVARTDTALTVVTTATRGQRAGCVVGFHTQFHVNNFLECMRSRRKPNSDVETTHRSTSAPHVANIAFKLGRKLRWNRDDEQFLNDPEANKLLTKQYRKPWNMI